MDNRQAKKQSATKDPMMEIFIDECSDLVAQYETYLSMADERNAYTTDIVNELFRITHTIKADAAMMLFECLAVPMRDFEHILYFYRDEKADIDFDRFTGLLKELVEFSAEEISRLVEGTALSTDGDMLSAKFKAYRDEIAGNLKVETVEDVEKVVKSETRDEPMRFYIGSVEEAESPEPALFESIMNTTRTARMIFNEERAAEKSIHDDENNKAPAKKTDTFPENKANSEELRELYPTIRKLKMIESKLAGIDPASEAVVMAYGRLKECNQELDDWLTNASTVPLRHITPKLEKTVEEMNQRLGRDITLKILGDDIRIDRDWIEGISGAIVHMLRNAVDHGIETKELRTSLGKPPEGNITVKYSREGDLFRIEVADDGRGIDIGKLRSSAEERGLIFDGDELSDDEIVKLIFLPGVSTNDKEGIYSGRGVGMDAVLHNVEVLGGRIETDTREGEGTRFTVCIPLKAADEDGETEEETAEEDEDFDRRR